MERPSAEYSAARMKSSVARSRVSPRRSPHPTVQVARAIRVTNAANLSTEPRRSESRAQKHSFGLYVLRGQLVFQSSLSLLRTSRSSFGKWRKSARVKHGGNAASPRRATSSSICPAVGKSSTEQIDTSRPATQALADPRVLCSSARIRTARSSGKDAVSTMA